MTQILSNCPACKKEIIKEVDTCSFCAFPFNGTEKEKAIHIGRFINEKTVVDTSDRSIKRTRLVLYIIGGLQMGYVLLSLLGGAELLGLILLVIVAGTFIVSGILLKKSPLLFTILPLILLVFFYAMKYIVDPYSLRRWIGLKVLIIGALCYNVYHVLQSNKFMKKYNV